jgi:hypothetical protein
VSGKPVLLTAYVRVENDLLIADALQLGSELWLVIEWNETQDRRWQSPARAIRIDQFRPQVEPTQGADVVLDCPLSKAAFDGRAPLPEGTPCVVEQAALSRFGWLPVRRTN